MDDITQTLLHYKGLVVGVWLAILLVGERLVPAVERVGGWSRVLRNVGFWVLNVGLSLTIVVPLSYWATDSAADWRPQWFNGWLPLFVDVIILDFLIYWWHRGQSCGPGALALSRGASS
jgi:hypothetical protein